MSRATLALLLACCATPAWADEAEAVKKLQKAGAAIERDDKKPGKPVVTVRAYGQWTDAELKELAHLPALQSLSLWANKVTDAGMKDLAALGSLHTLELGRTKVTDAGLKELAAAKSLRELRLGYTAVTDS